MLKLTTARRRLKSSQVDRIFSASLILPVLLITVIFIIVPVLDSVVKSFMAYKIKNVISGKPCTWNEFANYIKLFSGTKLLPSIATTFSFVICVVSMQAVLGMSFALVLNSVRRGGRVLRSVMMIPWVVPTVISALIWLWIYQPQYGMLRYLVSLFGVTDFAILNNTKTALFGIMITALWKQIPMTTLLLLAGLQNVPADMLEAAVVDGASTTRKFFSIVLPSMKPVVKIVISMAIIDNFKQFPLVWNMTGGGPNNATTTLAILSYREAFISNNLGSGAAVTTIWMLLMIVVIFLYNRFMGTSNID